jgi:hypothetical protein
MLVNSGWHPTSPWFLKELLRFVGAVVTSWVMCVGRRGGKSSFLCRLAVAQAVFGEWTVPQGDVGVVAVVSVSLAEAKTRLKTIRDILDSISEPYSATAESIRLHRRPAVFRAIACSLSGAVGFTALAILCDETAGWRDDTGSNPAREVIDKLGPTMLTVPSSFMVLSSAPDSIHTLHHERFLQGNNEHQIVSHGASWIANPTITEEQTHQLEPNERVWEREFAAIASEHASDPVLNKEAVLRALSDNVDRGRPIGKRVVCLDPSSGTGGDAFTYIVGSWNERADGTKVICVDEANGQRGPFHAFIRPDEIIRSRVRTMCCAYGASEVYSDQHLAPLVEAECKLLNLDFRSFPFTHENKQDAVRKLALMLEQDKLVLPRGNGWLRQELLGFTEKISKGGKTTWEARGKKHDDMVSALLILMICDSKGLLEGGPSWKLKRRDPPPRAGSPLESYGRPSSPRLDSLQMNSSGRLVGFNHPRGGSEIRNRGGF